MEFLAIGIAGVLIAALIVVPLIRRAGNHQPQGPQPKPRWRVRGQSGANADAEPEGEVINTIHIEGKVSSSARKQVDRIVEKHPAEAASVLKKWISSDD